MGDRQPLDPEFVSRYTRVNLVADPIHGYVEITKRQPGVSSSEPRTAEQDLLDHPWMQRARRIHQLQSAWWVFPSAEHSRFQHSVGAMHLAGLWTRHLLPSLRLAAEAPSDAVVEETLRLGGLLHDVGHGPFGHFFDEQYLAPLGITHETISQRLIEGELAPLIRGLDAAPGGAFAAGESIDPAWVAYVISKEELPGFVPPRWLELLKPVLCGSFAADNMDYVPRDAYICGVATGPVDVPRILHYSFVSEFGLTLHAHGAEALVQFLSARMYLYTNLYHHRTVRRIDLHMREIFRDTMAELLGGKSPLDDLTRYLGLNDWHLLNEVDRWLREEPETSRRGGLAREWARITGRHELKWKLAYEAVFELHAGAGRDTGGAPPADDAQGGGADAGAIRRRILAALPAGRPEPVFEVDVASLEARPNGVDGDRHSILLYDPLDGSLRPNAAAALLRRLPVRTTLVRIFTLDPEAAGPLRRAAEVALATSPSAAANHSLQPFPKP
jgi:HD superfamily phosphohydrolase